MEKRKKTNFQPKPICMVITVLLIAIFNIFHGILHELSKQDKEIIIATSTRNPTVLWPTQLMNGSINYYKLTNDTQYHYEFRFEYNSNSKNNDPQLMILLDGNQRICADYWEFSVGRRILTNLHNFRFLILAICPTESRNNPDEFSQLNEPVKWIYLSLQKWMNEVYFQQFQRYPRLYIHGIAEGSAIASLLSRVLPIQQQIFTAYPSRNRMDLTVQSIYPINLQKRLQLDPVFANWFYFYFCYNQIVNPINTHEFCPFQNELHNYQPVPPTYFIYSQHDPSFNLEALTSLISRARQSASLLGNGLLNHPQAIDYHVVSPLNATPTYMQEMFDIWHFKPHASEIFYKQYINQTSYNARQTCLCLPIDFRYFELHSSITEIWPQQQQDEYKDYANDIQKFERSFCEEVCGDLSARHGMLSRNFDRALHWINTIDSVRRLFVIEDYRDAMKQPDIVVVNPALNNVNPALNNVNPALNNINPALNNVNPALNNVNPASNNVNPALNNVNPMGQNPT